MSNEDVPVDIVASAIGIRIARGKGTVVGGTENTRGKVIAATDY
jgi:hypothetical protein